LSAAERLSHIGDEIVEHLVEWTKMLPFYSELPVEVHTQLLTQRWAELVLLSTCFFAYCTTVDICAFSTKNRNDEEPASDMDIGRNLQLLQTRLSAVMDKEIPLAHVTREAGPLVTEFTQLLQSFGQLKITHEAYVCLKAITILYYSPPASVDASASPAANLHEKYARKVLIIQEQFVKALQIHLSQCENGPRLSEILSWLPKLHSASAVLTSSKMFYVPFLICKFPERIAPVPNTPSIASNDDSTSRCRKSTAEEQNEETDTEASSTD